MPRSVPDLPGRLRRIMRHTRWRQADLARASGATPATVSRWLRDGEIQIDARYAFNLQDATGFSARWILLGDEPVFAMSVVIGGPDALRAEQMRHATEITRIFQELLGQ